MSTIYYKGTTADMKSLFKEPGGEPVQYSIGGVFSFYNGVWAFTSKNIFSTYTFALHQRMGFPYGPDHEQPVRYFAVTGNERTINNSSRGSWVELFKMAEKSYGKNNVVVLDNVQFLYEIPFEDMGITFINQTMVNYFNANRV